MARMNGSRSSWFQRGADAAQQVLPVGSPRCYICPLCLRGFLPKALETDLLTVEHVPPKALGGQGLVLTCRRCNSGAGARLDHEMMKKELIYDFHYGMMPQPAAARLTMADQSVNVEVQAIEESIRVVGLPGSNDPQVQKKLLEELDRLVESGSWQGSQFDLTFYRGFRHRPALVGWLRAGYLAAFAALGYRYIMRAGLAVVRQQLANPEEDILRVFSVTMPGRIPREERRILLVQRHTWMNSVAVQIGRHVVFLPSLEDAWPSLYEDLAERAGEQADERIAGKLIPWPAKPRYALDFL